MAQRVDVVVGGQSDAARIDTHGPPGSAIARGTCVWPHGTSEAARAERVSPGGGSARRSDSSTAVAARRPRCPSTPKPGVTVSMRWTRSLAGVPWHGSTSS